MRIRNYIASIALLLGGCLSPHQAVVTTLRVGYWSESAEITLTNEDTVSLRDLYVILRYNDSFGGDTLRLMVRTTSPDSLCYEEPFTLRVPAQQHAAALENEALIPYRQRVVLNKGGDYRITFIPTYPIQGIEAIGINIEKSE